MNLIVHSRNEKMTERQKIWIGLIILAALSFGFGVWVESLN